MIFEKTLKALQCGSNGADGGEKDFEHYNEHHHQQTVEDDVEQQDQRWTLVKIIQSETIWLIIIQWSNNHIIQYKT